MSEDRDRKKMMMASMTPEHRVGGVESLRRNRREQENPGVVGPVLICGKIWPFGLDGQIWTVFCKYLKLQYSDYFFVGHVGIVSSSRSFCMQETYYLRQFHF